MKKRKGFAGFLLISGLILTTGLSLSSCKEGPTETIPTSYKINVSSSEDYEIIDLSKTSATTGEEVSFKVNVLDSEKEIDEVTVSGVSEVKIEDGLYSFIMPEQDVTISASLKEKTYLPKAINVNKVEGFEVKILVGEKEVTEAKKGDLVTINILNTTENKRFLSLTSEEVTLTEVKAGEIYTFTMIDSTVNLTLEVSEIPSRSLKFTETTGVTAKFLLDGKEVTSALEGKEVILDLDIDLENYTFKNISATGTELEVVTEGERYSFVVGESDISITCEVTPIPVYNLSYNEDVIGASLTYYVNDEIVTSAKAGVTVKAVITLEEDYELNNLTSSEASLTKVDDLTYTFIMPASNVNLLISTSEIQKEYEVLSVIDLIGGFSDPTINVGDTYLEGSEVTFTFDGAAEETYSIYVNDVKYESTFIEGITYSVSFLMPKEDIDIVIVLDNPTSETGSIISFETNNELYKIYGISNNNTYSNSEELSFYVVPSKGVVINNVYGTSDDGVKTELYQPYYGDDNEYKTDGLIDSTTYKIEVEAEYVGFYSINFTSVEGFIISGTPLDEVLPGSSVSIRLEAEDGYRLPSSSYSGFSYKFSDSNYEASYEEKPSYYYYSNSDYAEITFNMPRCNVSFTITLEKAYSISYLENEHLESVRILDTWPDEYPNEITSAYEDEYVFVEVIPSEGYEVTGIKNENVDASIYEEVDYTCFRFYMPGEDLELEFEVTKLTKISYEESENYTISGLDEFELPGETVSFSINKAKGIKIDSVSLSDGTEVTYNESSDRYSFVVPNEDVSLIVETSAVDLVTITINKPTEGYSGSISVQGDVSGYLSSGAEVEVGEKISFSLNSYSFSYGYSLEGVYIITNNETIALENVAYYGYEYEFSAPSTDFTLDIRLNKETMNTITVNEVSEGYSEISSVTCYDNTEYESISSNTYDTYEFEMIGTNTCELTIRLKDSEIYEITEEGIEVKTSSGENVEFTLTSTSNYYEVTFDLNNEDIIVNINVNKLEVYFVSEDPSNSLDVLIWNENDTTIYSDDPLKVGDTVKIMVSLDSYSDFTANTFKATITNEEGEVLYTFIDFEFYSESSYYGYGYYYYAKYEFQMINQNITIKVEITPVSE